MMCHMKWTNALPLIALLLIATACSEDTSENLEAENFMRIYDRNTFSDTYAPIDMVQTSDDGYIILATRYIPDVLNSGIYILKTDKYGKFVRDLQLDDTYTNPLHGLTLLNNTLHFVCMTGDAHAKIANVDLDLTEITFTDVNLTYPSATAFQDSEFLVLSYDHVDRKTMVSRVNLNGGVVVSRSFSIADDDSMEDDIMKHFLRTGTQFPFQVGRIPGGAYFFNGFYDYTFSLVFTSLSGNDNVNGVVQGQQENGGFSAVVPLGSSNFAASYFNVGANYVLPRTTLSLSGPTSIEGLGGYNMKEMVPNAKVQIVRGTIDGRNVLVYASNTRSKQIGLFFYDESTGGFIGSKYLGFTNPYEVGNVMLTTDGGLAVAGTAFIAGRFSRVCLIKLSSEEVKAIIKE